MMSWLWHSSLLLLLVLPPLMLSHNWLLNRLGARSCYLLWLVIPVALLLPLLPSFTWHQAASLPLIETLLVSSQHLQQNLQVPGWLSMLTWLWLLGVILVTLGFGISIWQLHKQLRQCRHVQHSNLNYYFSKHHLGPAIFGVLRPSLIIPSDFKQRFSRVQRQLILQHELAHWHRGDLHANLLASLLLCLFWFHPLLWLAYRRYRADQELACDAYVLERYPNSTATCYANALLAAMQPMPSSAAALQPFCNQYGAVYVMKERLQQLKQRHSSSKIPALLILSIMCAVSVLWQQPVQADTAATLSSNSPSPVVRIYPRYPIQAAQERIEGMVQLRFNVEADGSTSQIEVILSQPEGVFEKEAIRALAQWRYQPAADELPNQGVKVQLDFVLD